MALLVFMCVENKPTYSRRLLANLLWGDRPPRRGRHSLTQALRRLTAMVGPDVFTGRRDAVDWNGGLACDALEVEESQTSGRKWSDRVQPAEFLADFDVGDGADDFRFWCDERRAHYRMVMVRMLDTMASEAVADRDWETTLEIAFRLVEIEPIYEEGHRRIMRAWSELGERALALQHYRRFSEWLLQEVEAEPDPRTQSLARELRGPPPESGQADPGMGDSVAGRRSIWR